MKTKTIASVIALGCIASLATPVAAFAKDAPAAVGVSADKLDAMENQANIGSARTDCSSYVRSANPQGYLAKGKTNYISPLWCTWMYSQSSLFTEPMTLGTTLGYGGASYAVGGDAASPPQFGYSMMSAPSKLGYDSNGAVPTEFFGFGRLAGIQGNYKIDSDSRDVWAQFTSPTTASGVSTVLADKAKTLSMKISGSTLGDKNVCRGPVTSPTDNVNSEYLRCVTTHSQDLAPGAPLKAQNNAASSWAGAVGYGAWPVTFRILNYLPVPLDQNSSVTPSNLLVEPKANKSSSGSPTRVAAAPNPDQQPTAYPAQVGDWTLGGYRSSTGNARYAATWRAGSSGNASYDSTYRGLEVNINAELLKGDNVLNVNTSPNTSSQSPSPGSTPVDPSKWCSISSQADSQCRVTVTGGMNKVVTFHILPFRR